MLGHRSIEQIFSRRGGVLAGAIWGACLLASCTPRFEPMSTKTVAASVAPIFEVTEEPYSFSMYPDYSNEQQSYLKLSITDKQKKFVHAACLLATLTAKDGHKETVQFAEDSKIGKYVGKIQLKHHEDYTVETHVTLPDSPKEYSPKFAFHCCDPIPGLQDDLQPGGRSK